MQGMANAVEENSSCRHGKNKVAALTAMKLLLGVVFLGWLTIWVVMPTNTYRNHWSPMLRSKTNSIYFGRQGTNMLICTFPILLIALLGCIYLHIVQKSGRKKRNDSGRLSQRLELEAWMRPVLVKGPLGIVSGTELAFCLMFVALLVWSFSSYLTTGFAKIQGKHGDNHELWQAKLETAALRLGFVGNLCLAFLFFPVTRMSSLLPLIRLTSESCIKYHVGHVVMVLFTAHGVCYVVYWAATNQTSEMLKWGNVGISNVAGEIGLVSGLFMWATTFPRIRRKMFELFFYSHQLYTLFLLFFLLHVGISFFCYILPGLYLFMVDRVLRFLQSKSKVRLVSARLLPSETVELNFSKDPSFRHNPLSIVFVNVPSISLLQWHPFTVTSNSNLEPERLSIIIKKEGSWTEKLYHTISSSSLDRLDVSMEGPYGPNSMDFLRYDTLVMVSGGSGITPFISMIRELICRSTTIDSPTPSVLLICAFKTSAELTMLDLLLPVSSNVSDLSRLQLRIEAFVTREKTPPSEPNKLIRTTWFKPNPSDLPVAPVLGSNSFLWLSAIISSSFLFFLLVMGTVTRYYVYPIEHNTNAIYSSTSRAVLNLLFLCICIAATSIAAVLWNKKRNAMEAKKIQNMETPCPMTSPSLWFYNAHCELESAPPESVVGSIQVHFGGRPDLKKMLQECEGSNIGVMASGPSALRQEVASICSSGSEKSMHFDSISFSW